MFWKKKKPKYEAPQVTDENFDALVRKSTVPVLLDFYADWCGPCKMMGPIIDELSEDYEGRALVAKVNSEKNPMLSQKFQIRSIPVIMFINNGMLIERYNGAIPKPNLAEILDEYLEGDKESV